MKQSLITQPENISLLTTSRFNLIFPKLPYLKFFVYTANLPGLSGNPAQQPTPFSEVYHAGDKLVYEQFNVTFLNDENLQTWLDIKDWMVGYTFPHKFAEYLKLEKGINDFDYRAGVYSDAILTVTSNAYKPTIRVHFHNCHPIYLSGIQFSNADNPEITSYSDTTFQFDTYDISLEAA